MSIPRLPKKVIRALSADESMERYFRLRLARIEQEVMERTRILEIRQGDCLLQIRMIHQTARGLLIEVA